MGAMTTIAAATFGAAILRAAISAHKRQRDRRIAEMDQEEMAEYHVRQAKWAKVHVVLNVALLVAVAAAAALVFAIATNRI